MTSLLETERLRNITPAVLADATGDRACSLAVLQDSLYLALLEASSDWTTVTASIWRYDFTSGQWEPRYEHRFSTEQPPKGPRHLHCKAAGLGAESDRDSKLWVSFVSPLGAQWLHSEDGGCFTLIAPPDRLKRQAFKTLTCGSGKVYALSESLTEGETSSSPLYVADLSDISNWQAIDLPTAMHQRSQRVTAIALMNEMLYAAVLNSVQGFELWRMDFHTAQLHQWESVLTKGAYRYSLNSLISLMAPYKGNLYFTSGTEANSRYLDGFELFCLYSNNDWDVIFGTPRFTPKGIRVPLSCQGPGLNEPTNRTAQCLIVHQDALYLGFPSFDGFQLWYMDEEDTWTQLPQTALSSYYCVNVLDAVSTSQGLVLAFNIEEVDGQKKQQIWLHA